MISLILVILAFLLCLLGAWWPLGPPYRPHLGWLGMACYFLAQILGHGAAR
jgi:hypothetical protein